MQGGGGYAADVPASTAFHRPPPSSTSRFTSSVVRCAAPHFRLVSSVSGRLDYIETIRQWDMRTEAWNPRMALLKLRLVPIAAHVKVRPYDHGDAEHRRLEHRVESGAVKAAPHERHVADRVQVGEDAHSIHHDHRRGRGVLDLGQPYRSRQPQFRGELCDAREVIRIGLVRREHQPGSGDLRH